MRSAMRCLVFRHEFDVFGIDEGQFFPDLVPFCEEQASHGKVCRVA
jgi:hypothetical protein